jgi:nanoRNase/pAp phosphatase (c-di-AMP/oligoRNAs hydrolase)
VDVNRMAGEFGGGGHVHAAGARVKGEMSVVAQQVAMVIERTIAELG